ncbi:MAG: divalent-cation tolerance protein CutA [Bdellovibrionales bacterium]
MTRLINVQTSTFTREDAEKLARTLVEQRLTSCVNIFRNEVSIYEWQNEMCAKQEYIMHIKTRAELFDKLAAAIKAHHPFDVPAIFGWDAPYAEAEYAAWVIEQTAQK